MKISHLLNSIIGIVLILMAYTLPFFTMEAVVLSTQKVIESVVTEDSGTLIFSMFFYVLHQLVIYFILYLGAMHLAYGLVKRQSSFLFQAVFVIIVFISVFLLNALYSDQYSLLTNILMIIGVLLFQQFVLRERLRTLPLSIVMVQIISSLQWLNLIPKLSVFGFGTDDLATSIKVADAYLTNNKLLNTLGTTFFSLFFVLTIFFTLLIFVYAKQIRTLNKYQEQERELKDARIKNLEARAFKETHALVHDLKTPLVSVEGLMSLLTLVIPKNKKLEEYNARIQESVQKMKDMISEILYEDVRKKITVEELINYSVSHTVINHPLIHFSVAIAHDLPSIRVNKIRLARALTNIIENAVLAIGGAPGNIRLLAEAENDCIIIAVIDDGPGIDPKILQDIWQEGFSTKQSTGLGLPFVKTVVENHGGYIFITSEKETKVKIVLPVEEMRLKNDNSSYYR